MSVRIAPSLISADFAHLGEDIGKVERGGADLLHLDVMDGHFVPNITFGPLVVKAVRKVTSLPLDVHLMIEDAGPLYRGIRGGWRRRASPYTCEVLPHLHRTVHLIQKLGAKAGVAINPATPVVRARGHRRRSRLRAGDVGQSGVRRPDLYPAQRV